MRLFSSNDTAFSSAEKARKVYPYLSDFATGCLMQDYDIFGDTPNEVLLYAKGILRQHEIEGFKLDILSFIKDNQGLTDKDFSNTYKVSFYPTITLENWDGKTTRQWLQKFYDLLSLPEAVRDELRKNETA